jgi:CxxC motif-containing protein (DUF1111 family)
MTRGYRLWYFLAVVLALSPAGARWVVWQTARARAVDSDMARAGDVLFQRDWQVKDSMCPEGDGLGPVYNATSCVACHNQGGPGGGGGLEHNVTTFTVRIRGQKPREGVLHAHHVAGPAYQETLQHIDSSLPPLTRPGLSQLIVLPGRRNECLAFPDSVHLSQRNTPALFGAKLIDEIPERVILANARSQRMKWGMAAADRENVPVGRPLRLGNGHVGRFGWKAQMASLSDFVQAACANELGLGNPGQKQPAPLYAPTASRSAIDLTTEQCNQLTAFCASLPRPAERYSPAITQETAAEGKKVFHQIGCAECHTPKLGSVDGLYSDLLLHRMGQELVGGGSYGDQPIPIPDSDEEGPSPSEWRTPPLWGVASSAPYLHDGRAATLEEAIRLHGGQAKGAARKFATLSKGDQEKLLAFLESLGAP